MEEKFCQVHEGEDILSFCFFQGCTQHFLCKECLKYHSDSHSSSIKSIMSLMRKDDWIKSLEEQRDSEIAHMKWYFQDKDCLVDENKKKLQGMIDEIIECIRNKVQQWIQELESLLDCHKNPKTKGVFAKLEDTLSSLTNIDFRAANIYDKVDKCKLFNETILPESIEVCKQVQDVIDEVKIDQSKLDCCKKDIIELLDSIHLKDLFALSRQKRQKLSEQLNLLQQEYENLKQEKNKQVSKLNQDVEQLKKTNNDLQVQLTSAKEQLNQLIESNNDYKQKIQSLTGTNEELQNEASMFEAELNSVVAAKLKLHADFEALNIAHNTLFEKYAKAEILCQDSRIIENKDVNNIKTWIPKPVNSDKSHSLRLDLFYRATHDSFSPSKFFKQFKDKVRVIIFVKSKEHGRVFGGYGDTVRIEESFVFSLTYGEKYPVKNSQQTFKCGESFLSFGQDIVFADNFIGDVHGYSLFPTSYECPKFENNNVLGAKEYLAGSRNFAIEDIEAFQVTWSK